MRRERPFVTIPASIRFSVRLSVRLSVLFLAVFLAAPGELAAAPPRTTDQLIKKNASHWHATTHHPFLGAIKNGTLAPRTFSVWLAQDYHFAGALLDAQSLVLVNAPRRDQNLLINGLLALDNELTWFEKNAKIHNINLNQPFLPSCRAYADFLLSLRFKPYVVQITCLWALERAYFDSWSTALPGATKYREFIDRWTTPQFKEYVDGLGAAANRALATASKKERALVEEYFLWVVRYEKEFWDMALSNGNIAAF